MTFFAPKLYLHCGKNCSKLVNFKEKKEYFAFFKYDGLYQFLT
jgi:hypothetical protein